MNRRFLAPGSIALAAGLLAATSAGAQTIDMVWEWDVSYSDPAGEINSPDDTVTAVLRGQFNAGIQFAGATFDVVSDGLASGQFLGRGDFAQGTGGNPMLGAITNVHGSIAGDDILNIQASQAPMAVNPGGVLTNPVDLYRITWRTDDLTPRTIDVSTENHALTKVFTDPFGQTMDLASPPGTFGITVTPTPGALALLGVGGALAAGRRRTS